MKFPDLTPDGSFSLGAVVYVKSVNIGISPILSIILSVLVGMAAGSLTATISKIINVPTVIAGLLVSSSLYSINWLILGKPNQFLEPKLSLVGDVSGMTGNFQLLAWLISIIIFTIITISIFSSSIWEIKLRAIGENPLLAKDINTSETIYTFIGLAIANGLVGLAGALFTQRSFSADISMGIGITISGLAGLIIGFLFLGNNRKIFKILLSIIIGSVFYRVATFITLEIGLPAELFRLISSAILLSVFIASKSTSNEFLRKLKWN